ncbi:MAG: ATP-binding cassette domain-containing protein, partial [Steroidobacteraceae bacterium]
MLDIRGLRKTFNAGTPNEVRSLRGIDLSIPEGMFLVVIGSNGSGKSTLLNAVAGSFLPDEGSLHIAGQDVTRWPEHRRARLVGRVFQNPFSGTAPTLSIAQNLSLASRRGMRRGLGLAQGGEQRPDMLSR